VPKNINITIRDKIALAVDQTEYICGNSDFIVNFDFDEEWNEFTTKTARFTYNGKFIDVVFQGNQCQVPIIYDTCKVCVGVYAGNLRTTTHAVVVARKSILCGDHKHEDPSPDVYNQLIDQCNKIFDAAGKALAFFKTVADMQASDNLDVGLFVGTSGYHSEGDGGGCVYKVIAEAEASYDIVGNGVAFRPVVNGVAYPKMFGTYNDGVTADNVPLQACFDYVADHGIATIDGANLTYYVDHSTDAITQQDHLSIYPNGITHRGVIIRTGVELKNYNSVLMPNTDILTPVLTILQSEENSFYIHDCEFDGNYGNHEERPSGTGVDGGRHLLFFTYEDTMFPNDFRACGDITIERCKLHNPDSYPIMISACDCTYTVKGCDIKSHAMGILTYATNCIVRDCTFETAEHYKLMVHNFCHDEIEFGENYTGVKKKNIEITNCRVKAPSIYTVEHRPQIGLNYGTIKILDCVNEDENGDIYVDYVDTAQYDTRKTIDNIEIRGCVTPKSPTSNSQENLCVYGADIGRVVVDDTVLTSCRFFDCNIDKVVFKDLKNEWASTITNSGSYSLDEVEFNNVVFNSLNTPLFYQASGVKNIKLRNCTCKNRLKIVSASSTVTKLNIFIEDFKYEAIETTAGSFIDIGESGEYNITVKDAQFLTSFGSNSFIYVYTNSTATGRIILQNVLAVDLPITKRGLDLEEMNVAFIGQIVDIVGIESVKQTTTSTEDGGTNVVTMTLTDGTKATFSVKNGSKGTKGDDGDDYVLTNADKAEIADAVKTQVPLVKTAEQPTFVNSVDDMTDTSKAYLMSDGYLWACMPVLPYNLTANDFQASSMNADGSIISSSQNTYNRMATKNLLLLDGTKISVTCPSPYQYIVYYYTGNATDTYIGKTAFKSGNIDDVMSDTVASGTLSGAKYCRVSLRDYRDATVDLRGREEEFATTTPVTVTKLSGNEWRSTGLLYNQPANYDDRVVALENKVAELERLVGVL